MYPASFRCAARHLGLVVGTLCVAVPAAPADGPARTYRNPLIPGENLADPAVIRHEGKYYMYPTSDGRGYDVYVSDDLIAWQRKPKVFVDRRGGAWAPDVFRPRQGDGRFYLYYTLNAPGVRRGEFHKQIGVAVADGPFGPFVDRGVLVDRAIDAHVFQDDDSALYLYYADVRRGFRISVQPLADPLSKRGEPREVVRPELPWEGPVVEGPWMLKRQGVYYLMYSGFGADKPDYAIGYATARSPLGPFQKHPDNPIARRGKEVVGPGHHSVVDGPDGRLWMVYHQKVDARINFNRFVAIDPVWFDERGVLHAKTTRGAEQPGP
jgi:beta-xylosidase